MAKTKAKAKRRPGGHPAKVTAQRERERERREGASFASELRRLASAVCDEAARFDTALTAELWASTMLGMWWPAPLGVRTEEAERELGGALAEAIARHGGRGALAALLALGEVCEGKLALLAREEADKLFADGVPWPPWGDALMDVEILDAAMMSDPIFGDGATILIEARHADEELPHTIGVYVDVNLGGLAKGLLLGGSIDELQQVLDSSPPDDGEIVLERIDPAEAGARIRAAMELTDLTLQAPVGEDYADLRALALLRAGSLPPTDADFAAPELSEADRTTLLGDFLAAPEGRGAQDTDDAEEVARLAVDYGADYLDGDPLRWSPTVVELFMADWLPRKLVADRSFFETVPAALDAWVRYAGRRRGIPPAAVELTVGAIATWTGAMLAAVDDPLARSPAQQIAAVALAAGVDLDDPTAVTQLVEEWNAGRGG